MAKKINVPVDVLLVFIVVMSWNETECEVKRRCKMWTSKRVL